MIYVELLDLLESRIDLERLSSQVISIGSKAPNEEKLKIEVEKLLGNFLSSVGVNVDPSYEYTFLSGERADAFYGHVIIEYEPPGTLTNKSGKRNAIKQIKKYMKQAAKKKENIHRFFGIVLDGKKVLFVRFISSKGSWETSKTFDVDIRSMGRLITAITALQRKPLDAEMMIEDFGPAGPIAVEFINTLYNTSFSTARSQTLFEDWERIFKQISSYSPKKMKGLEKVYNMKSKVDYQKLLFCIHTYYSLIMKVIAAEVVVLYGGGKFTQSFISELIDADIAGKLKNKLEEIENGSLFRNLNFVENFVEGDYFSWYLSEWNNLIHDNTRVLLNKISEYEVGTTDLEPERVRDLFKTIYQKLIPRTIRISLGEYYTPDWLVDLVLDSVGYTIKKFESFQNMHENAHMPLNLRLLDPACGSGTFLVLAIKRIKEYSEKYFIEPKIVIEKITSNIIGFDLNPLAVISSRTNYLLALRDLLRNFRRKEVPVYLANSIIAEEHPTLTGSKFSIITAVGKFDFPSTLIKRNLSDKLLSIIDEKLKKDYSVDEFLSRLKVELPQIEDNELDSIIQLYKIFMKLEHEGKNRIWTNILKNSFAPLFKGKFDYVVGNPPWISWDNLPESYRRTLEQVWDKIWEAYGGDITSQAAFKKDISALFVSYCLVNYMNPDGILGFLVPFTLFKTQSNSRFRRFLATNTEVHIIHNFVTLKPFEGATNRPALLLCSNGSTRFPIDAIHWKTKSSRTFDFFSSLQDMKRNTDQIKLIMEPIKGKGITESSWMMLKNGSQTPLRKAIGPTKLRAQEGINIRGASGIFYVEILDRDEELYQIQNMNEEARIEEDGEEMLKQEMAWVEPDLLYPLLRGRDVEKWHAKFVSYIVIPHDPNTGRTYDEKTMKINYENTYDFLKMFRGKLEERRHYGKPISDNQEPYYRLFQINKNTFNKINVVWKEISGSISGSGDLAASVVISPTNNDRKQINNKYIIANHKLMVIPCDSKDEAYFLAGILNSSICRLIAASYIIETSISTHLLDHIRILPFETENQIHLLIAQESKYAHMFYEDEERVMKIESKLDRYVGKLYGITNRELTHIKESLNILID